MSVVDAVSLLSLSLSLLSTMILLAMLSGDDVVLFVAVYTRLLYRKARVEHEFEDALRENNVLNARQASWGAKSPRWSCLGHSMESIDSVSFIKKDRKMTTL